MEDRRNVGEISCNSGDGTDQTGPILDVYDDDDDDIISYPVRYWNRTWVNELPRENNREVLQKGELCIVLADTRRSLQRNEAGLSCRL